MTQFSFTATVSSKAGQVASAVQPFSVTAPPVVTGATVSNGTTYKDYANATSWYDAATNYFDSYTSTTMAVTAQRRYFPQNSWPTSINASFTAFVAGGTFFQVTVKPSQSLTTSEQASLANTIALLQRAGVQFDMVLWTEANIGNPPYFPSATAYAQYVAYYGPVVNNPAAYFTLGGTPPTPVNLIYNPAAGANMATAVSFYPGDNYGGANYTFSAISADYYGNAFVGGQLLDPIANLADSVSKPFGLSEWGSNAGNSVAPTAAQFYDGTVNSYCGYLVNFFTARANNGKKNYKLIYYNTNAGTGTPQPEQNTVVSSADYKVAGLQYVATSMAAL